MKLVIDILEATYKTVQDGTYCGTLYEELRNGTPLPKGHGDLIDRDAFVNKCNADRNHSCYLKSWTADDVLNALQNSYTNVIIEADKDGDAE